MMTSLPRDEIMEYSFTSLMTIGIHSSCWNCFIGQKRFFTSHSSLSKTCFRKKLSKKCFLTCFSVLHFVLYCLFYLLCGMIFATHKRLPVLSVYSNSSFLLQSQSRTSRRILLHLHCWLEHVWKRTKNVVEFTSITVLVTPIVLN